MAAPTGTSKILHGLEGPVIRKKIQLFKRREDGEESREGIMYSLYNCLFNCLFDFETKCFIALGNGT